MWWRVFARSRSAPEPAALLEHLHGQGLPVTGRFRADDLGWVGGELLLGEASVGFERYLTDEDDLRDELNTWAAWLETQDHEPRHRELMQHVIGTRQLITMRPPDGVGAVAIGRLCRTACQFLARQADGVYQADGQGFFAADGAALLREPAPGES